MFITSLTLNGFKAFGDKTKIEFKNGIGALIGPNGSGKSNIIDAIKWVIGETKVSEIRGEKLEDIIFHGSVETQQQNMAEVEMVIDNQKKNLPLSLKEISIIRRLYRSGATECFINRKPCRLKDIQELFFNTGLGRGNYSVIPQGKIDQILRDKSGERRKLLEESSALSIYQEKKKEYEGQIFKTEENLKQLETIIRQEEKKKQQLESQSKKSEQFFKLTKELKEQQIKLIVHQLYTFKKQEEQYTQEMTQGEREVILYQKQLSQIKKEIESKQEKMGSQFEGLAELEKTRIKKNEQLESLRKEKNSLLNHFREAERHESTLEHHLSHHEEEKKSFDRKVEQNQIAFEATKVELKQAQSSIDDQKDQIKQLDQAALKLQEDIKQKEQALRQNRHDLKKASNEEKEILKNLIHDIDQLKKKLDQEKIVFNRVQIVNQTKQLKKNSAVLAQKFEASLPPEEGKKAIETLLKELKDYFSNFESYFEIEDPFYRFFFSAEGTYSKKENLEKKIIELEKEIISQEEHLAVLSKEKSNQQFLIKELQNQQEKAILVTENLEKRLARFEKEKKQIQEQLEKSDKIFIRTKNELKLNQDQIKKLKVQQLNNDEQVVQIQSEIQGLTKNIDRFSAHQDSFKNKLVQLEKKEDDLEEKIKQLESKKQRWAIEMAGTEHDIENLYHKGLEQFSFDLHQVQPKPTKEIHLLKENIHTLNREIKDIGPTNLLAKEEYDLTLKKLEEIYEQRKDILSAMEDLQNLSVELSQTTEQIFKKSFEQVKHHFSNIIKELFSRGEGTLSLSNEEDPLNSEIDIWVKPYGKKKQKMSLFSGGERTLIAVSFMFAFFMTKPSPLCLLDEVDAMLDSANITRFINLLKSIKDSTQLIFITHNQKTMQIFDYVYGISIREGKTKVLSLKL